MNDLIGWLALLAIAMLYFIPTLTAIKARNQYVGAIFLMNLFLGWTFLGWVGALIWAAAVPRDSHGAGKIKVAPSATNEPLEGL